MKQTISKLIRDKFFYQFWLFLSRLSNYGLNYGVASGYADYSGELYIIRKLKSGMYKNPVIFDVGANVGDWSKFVISTFKKEPHSLHMFEPLSSPFKALTKSIQKKPSYFFNQVALANSNGFVNLNFDTDNQGSAGAFIEGSYSEKVTLITLDEYCDRSSISNIHFLKMDVQGFEYQILQGAKGLLQNRAIHYIQFEIDAPCIENRIFFKDFWSLLNKDYKIYHSLYNGLIEINQYNATLENFRCMNYLAVLKQTR